MKIAVIPARGGSKRIPRKNVKTFGGKPMIAWSVQAARDTGIFDRIVVSTDDAEIAAVAQEYGADVPFMRPAELSDDHSETTTVIAHALKWHQANGYFPQERIHLTDREPDQCARTIARCLRRHRVTMELQY